jgi:hypothetical protein
MRRVILEGYPREDALIVSMIGSFGLNESVMLDI